jgi:PadR family transcriptional regulator PadR
VTETTDGARRKFRREIQSGANALRVLAVLASSDHSLYGIEVVRLVEGADGAGAIEEGTIYHILRSFFEQGLVMVQTRPTGNGPPRKYYVITSAGREALSGWIDDWTQVREAVDSILTPPGA